MNDAHTHTGTNGDRPARSPETPRVEGRAAALRARRRTPWPLAVVALLFVVVPALTWYWTWFGRSLTDEEVGRYLADSNPRHAQHALAQIAERAESRSESPARWKPQLLALARSPVPDLRMTAAWVMGFEHGSEDFREALAGLLGDSEPIVRRNAALALVRFGDARGRAELVAMLGAYPVKATAGGTALTSLTEGTPVKRGSLLVKFKNGAGALEEVRSPLPGRIEKASVKEGDRFDAGAELFRLAPDAEQARDALVGLYHVGAAEDLPEVERYAAGVEGAPADLREKAAQVAEAIRRRSGSK
jgi:hypothetical protein